VALPVKLEPLTVAQETLLAADQLQPLEEAVVLMLPLPPFLVNVFDVGEILKVQAPAVKVTESVFAVFMLLIVQAELAPVPETESQAPVDQATVEPLLPAAVICTILP
jgi:hypothetical protein